MFRLRAVAILLLVVCLSVPCVCAVWIYPIPLIEPAEGFFGLQMGAWAPEVVLPESEGGLEGSDHSVMIEQILSNSNSGLNPKPQVLLNAVKNEKKNPFAAQGLFYSELEKVTGGNLKFLFEANIVNVDFAMETVVADQKFYFYTYLAPTQEQAQNGTVITVYKTLIEKQNGTWVAPASSKGEAPVKSFSTSEATFYSIDHLQWVNT